MESKNLMIGDWILMDGHKLRVTKLTADRDYDNCEPIPLTAEILEKNGFVYEKDYGAFFRSRWGDIASPKYVTVGWCYDKMTAFEVQNADNLGILSPKKVAYGRGELSVHELQHALRLCGLTELADNFQLPELPKED